MGGAFTRSKSGRCFIWDALFQDKISRKRFIWKALFQHKYLGGGLYGRRFAAIKIFETAYIEGAVPKKTLGGASYGWRFSKHTNLGARG